MLIVVIVIIGLSLLILGHEVGHFFAAKLFRLKVDELGFGFPPRIAAWRPKGSETEYSVNWLPFGGFVRIAGERGEFEGIHPEEGAPAAAPAPVEPTEEEKKRLFYHQAPWKKSIIVLAGVFMNFIFGWLLIAAVLMAGVPQALVIAGIQPGSPAATVGIQTGDIVNGYTDSQSFIDYIDAHKGQPITVSVIRNNKTMDFTVKPRTNPGPDQGALGVELEQGGARQESFFPALWHGLEEAALVSWLTVQAFGNLIVQAFTRASLPAGVVGPVGIFGIAEETGKIGLAYLLQFLGIISLNLMVVNCIPFPALDGGRFLVILIEKVRGATLPYKVEAWVNGIGFALLLVLMVALTVRDVGAML